MTQTHGSVGVRVVPVEAAQTTWLEPGIDRYDEALWYLLWQGALAADEGALELPIGMPFGYSFYVLTTTAVRMLEQA
jgi:hypothetical protein